jgi:type IV pilus assembly protein PilO
VKLGSIDLSSLEVLRPILPLPMWQKVVAVAAGFVLIIAAYFYFGWMPVQDQITQQQQQVEQQQLILHRNQLLAKDLPRKRQEYGELEKQLTVALHMLPKKSEIPDLLENVSWAGKDSGLEFHVFKPMGEVSKQFYAEVPVSLDVSGSYGQMLTFLKRVGEMPRIVDVSNLKLGQTQAGAPLTITGMVTTYRFIEQSENAGGRRGQARR